MANANPRATRTERALHYLQTSGMRRGVMGSSKGWTYVFLGTFVIRRLRKAIGSESEVVFRGELKPGETFTIDHRPETYAGKPVRVRRRKGKAPA